MCWTTKPECSCTDCLQEQFETWAPDYIQLKVKEGKIEKDHNTRANSSEDAS